MFLLKLLKRHMGHGEDDDDDGDDMGMEISPDSPLIVNEEMNVGTIDVTWFPRLYWIFIGSFIAALTLINLFNYLQYRQRISAARQNKPCPAKPKNVLTRTYATLTAILREASNASLPSLRFGNTIIHAPTVGSVLLVVCNALLVLILTFYAFDAADFASFQNIAYRSGYMSMAQLPLIFLLAGKNNIIGRLTGSSYERLNWIHRWCARILLVTVTIHMAYWFANWQHYDYISVMSRTDPTTIRGLGAWAILVWIVFSSFAPIRQWNYEIFVLQHTLSFVAFIAMVFLHTPDEDHAWLWAPVAIYFFDRVIRAGRSICINLAVFHPQQKKDGTHSSIWACNAELVPLRDNVTRVIIRNPPISWTAGQHAFFSCHSIVPLQAHPFTISSIPQDGKLEFLVRSQSGGTKRFFDWAQKHTGLPTIRNATSSKTVSVALEGPYGTIRPLRQFDSVSLFGAGVGATFTMPLLRDILQLWKTESSSAKGVVTRHIRYIWVVKSRAQIEWFSEQLWEATEDVEKLRKIGQEVELDMSVYVTCDASFTEDWNSSLLAPAGEIVKTTDTREQHALNVTIDSGKNFSLKEKLFANNDVHVDEIDPRSDSESGSKACQPDGTCCCQTVIQDEDNADAEIAEAVICHCNCSHNPSHSSSSSKAGEKEKPRSLLHPSITLLSGRPHPRNIVRKMLEQARGESAVVVCGPKTLNHDVRHAVVALSDERAIHKGTGAQGVWFHGECFGY